MTDDQVLGLIIFFCASLLALIIVNTEESKHMEDEDNE